MTTDFKSYQDGVDLGDGTHTVGTADCNGVWKLLGMDEYDFRGKTVLDAGCNIGYFALKAAERGADVTAFDATPGSIAVLNDIAFKRDLRIRTFVCEFWSSEWREHAPFDVVIANRFLYYIKRPDDALREICESVTDTLFAYTVFRSSTQDSRAGCKGYSKVHDTTEWTGALFEAGFKSVLIRGNADSTSQYRALVAKKTESGKIGLSTEKWERCLRGGRMGLFQPAYPSGTRDHPHRWLIEETLDLIPDGRYSDILDIGCGDGWSAQYLCQKFPGSMARGITLSEEDKAMAIDRHPAVEVVVGDAHGLPYEDESQDIVVMRDSFEHMIAPFLVLEECCRVMRPSAWLLIAVPDEDWQDFNDHLIVPTDQQMRHLLKLAGLTVEAFSRKTFPQGTALTELRYLCKKLEPKRGIH